MSNEQKEKVVTALAQNPLAGFIQAYGPFAFGVAALLVLWFAIVSPQIDRVSIDYEKNREITDKQVKAIESVERIAQDQTRQGEAVLKTAEILERSIEAMRQHEHRALQVPD